MNRNQAQRAALTLAVENMNTTDNMTAFYSGVIDSLLTNVDIPDDMFNQSIGVGFRRVINELNRREDGQ